MAATKDTLAIFRTFNRQKIRATAATLGNDFIASLRGAMPPNRSKRKVRFQLFKMGPLVPK